MAQAVVNMLVEVFLDWNLNYRQIDRRAARDFIDGLLQEV